MSTSDADAARLYLEYIELKEKAIAIKAKLQGTPFAKVINAHDVKRKVAKGGVKKVKTPKKKTAKKDK